MYPVTLEYFYRQKEARDGLTSWCKKCIRELSKERKRKLGETGREKDRKYYHKNREEIIETKKQYYIDNKEHKQEYFANYQKTNKDEIKKHNKKYAEKMFKLTIKEWDACRLYFNYRCAYCGMTYEDHELQEDQDLHQEHAINEGLNDLSNCVPSCRPCNSTKHTSSLNEWYDLSQTFTEERYEKVLGWISFDHKKYIKYKSN